MHRSLPVRFILVLLAATLFGARSAGAQIPPFLGQWGSFGSGPGQFQYPYGAAVGPDGSVYITDQYNFRVQQFTPNGAFLRAWGSHGTGPGQFGIQIGVTTDASGRVYVSDFGDKRVQVFTSTGTYLRSFAAGVDARDIAIGPDGNFYVANYMPLSGNVVVYDSSGNLLRTIGSQTLVGPASLAFLPDGSLLVADATAAKLWKYDPVSGLVRNTYLLRTIIDPTFQSPTGLAILPDGEIYVCNSNDARVAVLSSSGALLGIFAGPGTQPGQLSSAVDVALAPNGDVYVVDLNGHRVARYGWGVVAARERSWGSVKTAYR